MASTAVVIAVGVNGESGEREVLGFDVGPSEDGGFSAPVLALSGRQRAVWSEARNQRRPPGPEGRRCGGPGRSLLAEVWGSLREECSSSGPQGSPADGGATIRTVFAQPDAQSAHQQWRRVSRASAPVPAPRS